MTPLRILLVTAALGFLGGCSMFLGSETGFGGVSGVVVDHTHTGVRNATVSIAAGGPPPQVLATARTNIRGEFTIDKVPAGHNLRVTATKTFTARGVQGHKDDVRVSGGRVTDVGEIEIGAKD
jgi:hypothetical protein